MFRPLSKLFDQLQNQLSLSSFDALNAKLQSVKHVAFLGHPVYSVRIGLMVFWCFDSVLVVSHSCIIVERWNGGLQGHLPFEIHNNFIPSVHCYLRHGILCKKRFHSEDTSKKTSNKMKVEFLTKEFGK